MTALDGLWLSSSSLLSKWGFWDGAMPQELFDWVDDRTPAVGGAWPNLGWLRDVWEQTLHALVVEHLLPLLGREMTLAVGMNHNPVRAETIDGVEVPNAVFYGDEPGPELNPDGVLVPFGVVVDTARRFAGESAPVLLDEPRPRLTLGRPEIVPAPARPRAPLRAAGLLEPVAVVAREAWRRPR